MYTIIHLSLDLAMYNCKGYATPIQSYQIRNWHFGSEVLANLHSYGNSGKLELLMCLEIVINVKFCDPE